MNRPVVLSALALTILFLAASAPAAAQPQPARAMELAERFAPTLYLHPHEDYHPVSPEYALGRSDLRNVAAGLITPNPTSAQLVIYTDPDAGFYLDNRLGAIEDNGIRNDFAANAANLQPVVHARVTTQNYRNSAVHVIQYFMYYPFNNGPMNTHEGDWESVMVVADLSDEPLFVAYSQHLVGAVTDWSLVLTENSEESLRHSPKVFVARGSHANYFRWYEGGLGPAQDECSASGRVLRPADYSLVMLEDQGWLMFGGHWGDYGRESSGMMGERGPLGPAYQGERWDAPISWTGGLKETSEASLQLNWALHYLFWIVLGIMGLAFLVAAFAIYRRKRRQGTLGSRLLPFLYISGPDVRVAAALLIILAMVLGVFGYFLPWYSVTMDVEAGAYSTPGPVEILRTNGIDGMSFNRPEPGAGMVQVVGIPIPAGFLMLVGLMLFVFSSIGVMSARKYGWKVLRRGFAVLVPAIILIAQVSLIGHFVRDFAQETPPEVMDIIETVSANPLSGSTTGIIGEYGIVTLEWGIGPGVMLLVASALMLFIAAVMLIMDNKAFFRAGPPAAVAQPYGQQQAYPAYQPPGYGQYQPYTPPPPGYGPPPSEGYGQPQAYGPPGMAQPCTIYCPGCNNSISIMPGTGPFQCQVCGTWNFPPDPVFIH